jgi:hypothetical protein
MNEYPLVVKPNFFYVALILCFENLADVYSPVYVHISPQQAADINILGSLSRDDLKKLCGDNFPEWVSFQQFEQVNEATAPIYVLSYEK